MICPNIYLQHFLKKEQSFLKPLFYLFSLTLFFIYIIMADQAPQRTRLTKSKATASTTAIQTLEITTTAVVNINNNDVLSPSPPTAAATEETELNNDLTRKQSHHHHHHHIRSPAFEPNNSTLASPLSSPQVTETMTPAELILPPPIVKGPSEAIVALQDAANGKIYIYIYEQID